MISKKDYLRHKGPRTFGLDCTIISTGNCNTNLIIYTRKNGFHHRQPLPAGEAAGDVDEDLVVQRDLLLCQGRGAVHRGGQQCQKLLRENRERKGFENGLGNIIFLRYGSTKCFIS